MRLSHGNIFDRASVKQMSYKDAAAVAAATGGGEELSSEYESIDPSIFGRVKAKIRKSQVRAVVWAVYLFSIDKAAHEKTFS